MNDTLDAHIHIHLSDDAPSQSPRRVCRTAKAAGVRHLRMIDPNRIPPGPPRQELPQTYRLDVISGCEFNGFTMPPRGRCRELHGGIIGGGQ